MKAQYLLFKDIKHQFPENSWIYRRNEIHKGEFEDEWILYIDGSLKIGSLNLDDPVISFQNNDIAGSQPVEVMSVLINGDLKAGNIYNDETDGAAGLYVLGNVYAENILIGGQELYVTGNMNVAQCFWGDYNHGELVVEGITKSRVFVATEEYHYDDKKERTEADYFLCDDDEEDGEFDRSVPEALFADDIVYTEDETDPDDLFTWNGWISRSTAVSMLKDNLQILKKDIQIRTKKEKEEDQLSSIPRYFGNSEFNDGSSFQLQLKNFHQLMDIVQLHKEDDQYYDADGYEVQLHPPTHEAIAHVMFTHRSGAVLFICIEEEEDSFRNQLGTSSKKEILSAVYRENEEMPFTDIFNDNTPAHYIRELNALWNDVLTRAERGAYFYNTFLETVKPEALIHFLNLPVVTEKYNDYWDAEKNSFEYGGYSFFMRLHGAKGMAGSIDIGKESEGEHYDMRTYFFRPDTLQNPEKTNLFYSSSLEEATDDSYSGNKAYKVFLYDWELYREAIAWYPKIEKAFIAENDEYLEENGI